MVEASRSFIAQMGLHGLIHYHVNRPVEGLTSSFQPPQRSAQLLESPLINQHYPLNLNHLCSTNSAPGHARPNFRPPPLCRRGGHASSKSRLLLCEDSRCPERQRKLLEYWRASLVSTSHSFVCSSRMASFERWYSSMPHSTISQLIHPITNSQPRES